MAAMIISGQERKGQGGRGFTLVELLVVISIIALLIGLLLPSLKQAHEQGQRIICLANMRQHGVAYISYANDWSEALPTVAGPPVCADSTFVGYSAQKNFVTGAASIMYTYSSSSHKVWICPEFYNQADASADAGGGYGLTLVTYYDYGPPTGVICSCYPIAGSFGWFGWSGGNTYSWAEIDMATAIQAVPGFGSYLVGINSMSRLKKPSTVSMEVEIFPIGGGFAGYDGRTFDPLGGNARHGGDSVTGPIGGNVLYADGHARWSNKIGPVIPWNFTCFTDPSD